MKSEKFNKFEKITFPVKKNKFMIYLIKLKEEFVDSLR